MKQIRSTLVFALIAAFLLWQAVTATGPSRASAIIMLAGLFGTYGWLRFTQSGKRFFSVVSETFKRPGD